MLETSPPPTEPLCTTALPPPCTTHLSRRACRLRNSPICWRGAVSSSECFEVVPQSFLPVLCRLAGARVSPPLESPGGQQSLWESLVSLSCQGPCEQKPSLANCRFHNLAPGFLESFSVRHPSIRAVNAAERSSWSVVQSCR